MPPQHNAEATLRLLLTRSSAAGLQVVSPDPWDNASMRALVDTVRREQAYLSTQGEEKSDVFATARAPCKACYEPPHASLAAPGASTSKSSRRVFPGQAPWRPGMTYECDSRADNDLQNHRLSEMRAAALGPPGRKRDVSIKVTDNCEDVTRSAVAVQEAREMQEVRARLLT